MKHEHEYVRKHEHQLTDETDSLKLEYSFSF
jgi:hypothetical protein